MVSVKHAERVLQYRDQARLRPALPCLEKAQCASSTLPWGDAQVEQLAGELFWEMGSEDIFLP